MKIKKPDPPKTCADLKARAVAKFDATLAELRKIVVDDPQCFNPQCKEITKALENIGYQMAELLTIKGSIHTMTELKEVEICKCQGGDVCIDCQPYKNR